MISFDWGTALEMALVLMAWSLLYRENVFFRIAESLVIGWFMGFSFVVGVGLLRGRVFVPLFVQGQWLSPVLIMTMLGIFYWLRLYKKTAWLARWPISLLAGTGTGVAVKGIVMAQILRLVTMRDLLAGGLTSINNLIILVFTAVGLLYFVFTREHKGPFGAVARFGLYALIVAFGWTTGTYLMSLVSMSIGHMRVLMQEPGIYVSAIGLIVLAIGILYDQRKAKKTA
jgi:hypothetical protein